MVRCGIIGGAGYTAGELIRLLVWHPEAEIAFVQSSSHAMHPIAEVHTDLAGILPHHFSRAFPADAEIDVLFLCGGHGKGKEFLEENDIPSHVRVIDLGSDFRLKGSQTFGNRSFTYGLPEMQRGLIRQATSIANPGCFATAIQLGLLPLAASQKIEGPIHVNGITGSTGAGVSPQATTHFSWRTSNVSIYKPFEHQHLDEIGQSLATQMDDDVPPIYFIPMRGNFTRGIFATIQLGTSLSQDEAMELFEEFYATHPFTTTLPSSPDLKSVINTNRALVHPMVYGDQMLVTVVIDNLLKGASGQAVQNMNLMMSLDERSGLNLKGIGF